MRSARQKIEALDQLVVRRLTNGFRPPGLTRCMRGITLAGTAYVWLPVYLVGLGLTPILPGSLIATCLVAEIILFPCVVLLRYTFRRQRPAPHAQQPWEPWNRFSFPSFHAARIWMLSTAAASHFPGLRLILLLIALLVSFSRIYLFKHYLSDVLAGALMGGATATSAILLLQAWP